MTFHLCQISASIGNFIIVTSLINILDIDINSVSN